MTESAQFAEGRSESQSSLRHVKGSGVPRHGLGLRCTTQCTYHDSTLQDIIHGVRETLTDLERTCESQHHPAYRRVSSAFGPWWSTAQTIVSVPEGLSRPVEHAP